MSFQILQPRLFSVDKYQAQANYEPGEWEKQPDIVWHGSESSVMPEDQGYSNASTGGGFHVGTKQAAEERTGHRALSAHKYTLHPLQIRGQMVLPPREVESGDDFAQFGDTGYGSIDREESKQLHGPVRMLKGRRNHMTWGDDAANYSHAARRSVEEHEHTVPYVNEQEHRGSVSYRAPRENILTWAEAVHEDPNAPNWAKAARDRGFDLSHPVYTAGTEYPRDGGQQLSLDLGPSANSTTVGYDGEAVARHVAAIEYAEGTKPRLRRPWKES